MWASALQPSDREQARRVRAIASKYATRIHSDAFGGMIKLASQDEYGLLGPDVHLQHCHGLSMEEVQIVAETDTRIGHSPGPSAFRCPVPELMQAGATVAVTTDGTSPRQSFDLFQAMRKAQLLQQVHFRDRAYLPPGKLLEMVTIDAARALGWEDEIGSLEAGKKADIIVINMRQPHLMPNFMPVHRLVYEAVGNDVETVIVDGRVVMEQGKNPDRGRGGGLRRRPGRGAGPGADAPVWSRTCSTQAGAKSTRPSAASYPFLSRQPDRRSYAP